MTKRSPKMTKRSPKMTKKSEILKKAKELIAGDHTSFVCFAISCNYGSHFHQDDLRVWVESLLDENITLEGWMEVNHPHLVDEIREVPNGFKLLRLEWIDWMIQFWEEKELKGEA